MDLDVVDVHLSKAASLLGEVETKEMPARESIDELQFCEKQLVAGRFTRRTNAGGYVVTVKVPGVDAALIHITRAISLIGEGSPAKARATIKEAREEVSHISE